MAEKIAVESGNPYRDNKGRLATSPNKALDASFAALKGKTFVPKGKGGNKDIINAKKKEAEDKLAAIRNQDNVDRVATDGKPNCGGR